MGLNVLTVTETIKLQEGEKAQPEPGDLDPRWPRLFLHFILLTANTVHISQRSRVHAVNLLKVMKYRISLHVLAVSQEGRINKVKFMCYV